MTLGDCKLNHMSVLLLVELVLSSYMNIWAAAILAGVVTSDLTDLGTPTQPKDKL